MIGASQGWAASRRRASLWMVSLTGGAAPAALPPKRTLVGAHGVVEARAGEGPADVGALAGPREYSAGGTSGLP